MYTQSCDGVRILAINVQHCNSSFKPQLVENVGILKGAK